MSGSDRLLLDIMLHSALRDKKGGEFERFFTAAAIELWGDDFEPWKPQGNLGDFKCDGYRISEKTVFQCNAPEQFVAGTVAAKIEKDFKGALEKFGARMERWIFVHNQTETPARAANLLHGLRQRHPKLELKIWTLPHLSREIRALSDAALRNLFRGFSMGHEFSEPMAEFIAGKFGQSRPPLPTEIVSPELSNQGALYDTIDRLGDIDREVRRRLLGYSRWFDPATKAEVERRLEARGYERDAILANAQRLHDENLICITENHYLAVASDICQQAAETLLDEFTGELEP
ncbi:hypothetical protein [Rhizobium leguminosarum]|uniref:hypothetical protein n=1 Tax=Rhizobium leguminosarum TaxID=384 RepID=UPI0014422030|nr:hypothetical protein [Rhizobium leguminosarum]MBY5863194.1 hypothetical protein [Rhizobium leguminosarum]NKM04074.1 hypothetical protein [Rhizobium leguminosarum bv. viciae]